MTCNDCIHVEACLSHVPRTFWDNDFYKDCKHFKGKDEIPYGWVSVNEKLPPKNHDVLIAYNCGDEIEIMISQRINSALFPSCNEYIRWNLPQFHEQRKVLAWRELPVFDFYNKE